MKQLKKHLCSKQTKEERGKKALSRVVDKIGEEEFLKRYRLNFIKAINQSRMASSGLC